MINLLSRSREGGRPSSVGALKTITSTTDGRAVADQRRRICAFEVERVGGNVPKDGRRLNADCRLSSLCRRCRRKRAKENAITLGSALTQRHPVSRPLHLHCVCRR
jgi:hypothetical protein